VALPLLEYATVEHEDDLHTLTLWANLATGMDASEDEIHRKYVTTLGEMTAEDAAVLAAMFVSSKDEIAKKKLRNSTLTYGPGIDGTHSHDAISVITLDRLGLIEPASVSFKTFEPGWHDDRYGDCGPTQDEVSFPGNLESVVMTPLRLSQPVNQNVYPRDFLWKNDAIQIGRAFEIREERTWVFVDCHRRLEFHLEPAISSCCCGRRPAPPRRHSRSA
jgi:hypothetical protein